MSEEPLREPKENSFVKLRRFYETHYRTLLYIPVALLVISFILLGIKVATTGEIINKDVSLTGGIIATIPLDQPVDVSVLESQISPEFPHNDIAIRALSKLGEQIGIIVESDMDGSNKEEVDALLHSVQTKLGITLSKDDYSLETSGSSLAQSFFREILIALLLAFLFMGIVVFVYFRTFVPSIAVILAAFSDIVVTLAIVNLLGMRLSTAGIVAFLMLIGYSVDTDILLTTKVLKTKEGTVMDRVVVAFKTGIMMTLTTIVAIIVALLFTESDIIRQIMTILLIGLLVDIINTWIQNVSILRIYTEKKYMIKHE